jgi:peptide deformylase|tara:strand:+ start:180 stop:404 length:225 start_codon:yes stop_codon:yes gene_type:complete
MEDLYIGWAAPPPRRINMNENNLIAEIEEFLAITAKRTQFTAQEIQNLLLDLRNHAEHDRCVSLAASLVPEKET